MQEVQSIFSERIAPLQVGVIGAGWISSTFHVPVINYYDEVDLTYVADTDWSKARNLANAYDATGVHVEDDVSVVPDCDIALLSVPVGIREQYIQLFGDRDTAVFCEKPVARTYEEHSKFTETVPALFANYQRTCYSAPNQLQKLVKSDVFGSLRSVKIREGSVGGPDKGIPQDHYRTNLELAGGGVLIEVGCHTLSQLVHILDEGKLAVREADITYYDEFDSDISAKLAYETSEREVDIDYRVSSLRNIGNGVKFMFENTRVTFDPFHPGSQLYVRPTGKEQPDFTIESDDDWGDDKYRAIYLRWKQFVADLRGEESLNHVKTAPEVTRLITDIYEQDSGPRKELLS